MSKATEIVHDAYLNIVVRLPLEQVAKIHGCSKSYVTQVCKGYGIQVDRRKGVLIAPISTLQKVFWPREDKDEN